MALGRSPISLNDASNITHSAIATQDSSWVTTTFNALCTAHCSYTVQDFNVNFANHDGKSVRYRTVLCAWYHVQERNVPDHGSATSSTGAGVHYKVVWGYHEPWLQEVVLLEKTSSNRSDPFLYDQSFRSQRWARFSLSFCLSVTSSVVHYEDGDTVVWFVSKRLGLIAWLRESMSRRNPSSRSASSPKVEEKLCSFSPYGGRPEEASIDQVAIKSLYHAPKIYIKCWNRKILALRMPPISLNTASNITHSAIASQDSSRVTTTFDSVCIVEYTVRREIST